MEQLDDLLKATLGEVERMLSTKTVVGEPFEVRGNTLIPLVAAGLARGWTLRLEPEFSGPAFAGHARVVWAVRPGAVLWPVGTFVLSPTTWRATIATLRPR
jgi:uncharacterized spore protein YtfJ